MWTVFYPSSNFFVFQYFCMRFFLESHLILKRSFPASFVDKMIFCTSYIFSTYKWSTEKTVQETVGAMIVDWLSCIICRLSWRICFLLNSFFSRTFLFSNNIGGTKHNCINKRSRKWTFQDEMWIHKKTHVKNIEKQKS